MKNNWKCSYFVNDRVSRGGQTSITPKSENEAGADTGVSMTNDSLVGNYTEVEKKQRLLMAIEEARTMLRDEKNLIELSKKQKRKYTRRKQQQQDQQRLQQKQNLQQQQQQQQQQQLTDSQTPILSTEPAVYSHSGSNLLNPSPTSALTPLLQPSITTPAFSPLASSVSSQEGPSISPKDILVYLPEKARCFLLIEVYKMTVHPIIPVIDIDQFTNDHDEFWNSIEHSKQVSTDFLLLLFPILYAATKSEFHRFNNNDELFQEMGSYQEAANVLYAMNDFPNRYSLKILTGFVLINSIVENPNITIIAQLSRLAQRAMLTRDPASYHEISDASLVQSRRILFWQIFQLDTMTSLHNNLPPLMKLDEFDTALPAEVVQGKLNPSLCFLNAKYRFVLLLNELCTQTNTGMFQGLKERIVDLHACCMGSALSLRSYLKQENQPPNVNTKFIEWAVFMLNTFADRACLLLHLNIIKTSMPLLMKRRRLWKEEISSKDGAPSDPIAESGYGKNFLTIQSILNDSGNLTLEHALIDCPDGTTASGFVYNYEDLTSNLIPASLHYLDEFLKYHSDENYSCYNWELLVGNMPINAITFALKTLALDLNRAQQMNQILILQNDLRYILLSKAIPVAEMKVDHKTAVCKNCFQLIKLLFRLIIVKFGTIMGSTDSVALDPSKIFYSKYDVGSTPLLSNHSNVVPQPSLSTLTTEDGSGPGSKRNSDVVIPTPGDLDQQRDTNRILSITSIINSEDLFNDGFSFSGNLIYNNNALDTSYTTSCAQIAPRTMRALASLPHSRSPYSLFGNMSTSSQSMDSNLLFNPFFKGLSPASEFVESQAKRCTSAELEPEVSSVAPVFEPSQEIDRIYQEVQRYIVLLNGDTGELEAIGTGDEYYREFENALLEIICGILSS